MRLVIRRSVVALGFIIPAIAMRGGNVLNERIILHEAEALVVDYHVKTARPIRIR